MDRNGQDIAAAEAGVRLFGGLAIDADRPSRDQSSAVAALPHEAGAPQPLVQTLPVAILGFRYGGLL